MLQLLTLVACVGVAAASYANNLNYRSPSHHHPALGISIHKVNKRNAGAAPEVASKLNFTHGVASGDPFPHSVILWTRCAPASDDVDDNSTVSGLVPLYNPVPIYDGHDNPHSASTAPVCLKFLVAKDPALKHVVDSGRAYTSSDVDYTLKVRRLTPEPRIGTVQASSDDHGG
jgi:alkaline phosphatase D